jgi:hypothetical protein
MWFWCKSCFNANLQIRSHLNSLDYIVPHCAKNGRLHQSPDDEVAMRDAEAAIESDVDIETRPREFSTLVARAPAAPDAQPPAPVAERRIVDRDGLIAALVDEIERDPYQAHYRLGPVGTPLTGWSERLRGYFWPSPALGFARTMSDLSPLLDDGRTLAEALRPWDKPTQLLAVALVHEGICRSHLPLLARGS